MEKTKSQVFESGDGVPPVPPTGGTGCGARPVFIELLIAAIAIYIVGTAFMMSDLYKKVGALEFAMDHITGKCPIKH